MNKVSIVVPVYNAEDYIEECINSVLAQTYTNWELILVNDGSTDASRAKCEAFVDERIRCFTNSNHGVSYTRNYGVQQATGEWVMFVDADDVIAPGAVEALLKPLSVSSVDMMIGGFCKQYLNTEGEVVSEQSYHISSRVFAMCDFAKHVYELMRASLIQGPCYKLFRRELILNHVVQFPLEMSYGEDTVFVYRYLEQARTVAVVEDIIYNYRFFRSDSLSVKFRQDKLDIHLTLNDMLRQLIQKNGNVLDSLAENQMATLDVAAFFMFFNQLQHGESKYGMRKKYYQKYAHHKPMMQSLSLVRGTSLKYRLAHCCLKCRCFWCLDLLFWLNQRKYRC